MRKLEKNIVVVGGSTGLGKVLVQKFANAGNSVVVISRETKEFIEINPKITHIPLDLLRLDQGGANHIANCVANTIGTIHYIIFCQRYRGPERCMSNEIAVSLTATEYLLDAFIDKMALGGDRAIAMVSSVYGDYVGSSQPLFYHVVKAGMNALVRYYAVKLGAIGVRVNSISPLTYLKEESKHVYLEDAERMQKYRRLVPLQRMGTAEECANTLSFLCSEQSSFITGQNLYVDGGVSVVWPEEMI